MIITRTPLRISLGGGGTDLESYYSKYGGFILSASINKYIYITLHNTFQKNFILKYSQMENVQSIDDIKHNIIREAFRLHDLEPKIELVSIADIPSGTGLGSSSSFTVGLLKAIYAHKREHVTTYDLAEEACKLEIDVLKEPIGKQDQYIASFGGLSCLNIDKNGYTKVSRLNISDDTLHDLEDNLLMFFTGYSRNASDVLLDQKVKTQNNDQEMIENLHFIKQIGYDIKDALEKGDVKEFGDLMHEHWLYKKKRSPNMSNSNINKWYGLGYNFGARGGKLIGAGGGGFLLFYCQDKSSVRKVMAKEGLQEVRFGFDFQGSKIMVQ